MITIQGDLILTEDTTFNESIKVIGDIKGYDDLKVIGNINCRNINCRNIILCNKIKVKKKCLAKALIKDRYNIKQKEIIMEKKQ